MRNIILFAALAGFVGATAASAAPLPSASRGIDLASQGDLVQVKMKTSKKKKTMNRGMSGQGGGMNQGSMSQPAMGGSAGAGQPMGSPSQKQQ